MKIISAGRLMIWIVALSVVLTIVFHRAYPYTDITPQLETVLVLFATIVAVAADKVVAFVGARSNKRSAAASPGAVPRNESAE